MRHAVNRAVQGRSAELPNLPDLPLGPLGLLGSSCFMVLGILAHFEAFPHEPFFDYLLTLTAFGLLFVVPAASLRRLTISIPAALLMGWIALSTLWTTDPERTNFLIRLETPYVIGVMICAGLLSDRRMMQFLYWVGRLGIAVSLLAVLLVPATRDQIKSNGAVLEGWRGLFGHKNDLGPFLALFFGVILVVERRRWIRTASLCVTAVLIVGSQSVTALTTILVVMSVYAWLRMYRGADDRVLTIAVLSTLSLAIAAALGLRAGLPFFLEAAGKDPSFSGRTDIWSAVIRSIGERPLHGWGRGGLFFPPGNERTVLLWRDIGFRPPHSHNGVLDQLSQIGLIGFALFSWLLGSLIRLLVRSYRRQEDFGTFGLVVVTAIVVPSLSENVFLGPYLTVLIALHVLALRIERRNQLRRAVPPAVRTRDETGLVRAR